MSGRVESHADTQWGVAGAAKMFHFVPAVADTNCPLILQHGKRQRLRENGFVHEHPAQLGLSARQKGLNEILFDIQVLIEEFRKHFLVDIMPDAHHGKLEEAGHGRG
jgi:hypothetical protein